MSEPITRAQVIAGLDQRLRAVAGALTASPPADDISPAERLEGLVRGLSPRPSNARVWLLLTAISAQFPGAADVAWARRRIELERPIEATVTLLSWAASRMSTDDASAELELVTDRALVDVDFCAQHDVTTGIQRVVRSLVPHWVEDRPVQLVRWIEGKAYIGLTSTEMHRVTNGQYDLGSPTGARRLVPWSNALLLPEVPSQGHSARLAALAEFGHNRVNILGHDCIPLVSADLVPAAEHDKFSAYIEVVKYADVVAAVSHAASTEFAGFAAALGAQGLSGPRVVTCLEAWGEPIAGGATGATPSSLPTVICVSGLDRRKNQIAAVEAAEHLWRRGVKFQLELIGWGGARPDDVVSMIEELVAAGRPLVVRREVSDAVLDAAYRQASVAVFPTRHEGFGLPVSEALSYGIPVVTSDFGSVRELAEDSGGVLVDPEDPLALADALEAVLTDPELHSKLVTQAKARPERTWKQYADDLWEAFA